MKISRPSVILAIVLLTGMKSARADEWPQWRGINRDGIWAESGLIDKFDSPQIKLKWRVPIGAGYTGPTVARQRVYVMDRITKPDDRERVHCLDWQTGKKIWSHEYDCLYADIGYKAGPRASVLVDDGRAYSLGAAGHLFCFDAAAGTVKWKHDLRAKYKIRMPNWGIAAAPLIEGDLVIVQIGGDDDACLCAFDKISGKPRWQALGDDACYSAPIVVDQAGRRVLVCLTGDRVVGLDPATGRLHWEYPWPWRSWPIGIATPVVHKDLLLISDAHNGTLLLRLSKDRLTVEKLWHLNRKNATDGKALHCLNATPLIDGQYIYGTDGRGILRCLRLKTGEQLWEDESVVKPDRFGTAHLISGVDRTWIFNEKGELIISRLSPDGFKEISRAKLIEPTRDQMPGRRGGVTWSHPAFAYRHVFARNDKELVCADLAQ